MGSLSPTLPCNIMGLLWEPEFGESKPSISSYVSSSFSPSSSSSSHGMVKELRSARAEMRVNQDREKKKRIRQGRKEGEGGGGMRIKHVKRK